MRSIYPPIDEQRLVQQFFGKSAGVFVDVGAHDPVINSQTRHLERLGWTGILIEPLPEYAQRLTRERKAQVFQVACGARSGVMPLHVAGAHSSLLRPDVPVQGVIEVAVRTLDSIIEEAGFERIDFLSLDVEGFELDVLSGFAIERWKPGLILIEDHVLNLAKHRYLASHGYRLVRRTGVNAWYIPRDRDFPLDLHGRWQLFRKYVIGLPFRKLRSVLGRQR